MRQKLGGLTFIERTLLTGRTRGVEYSITVYGLFAVRTHFITEIFI